MSASFRNSISTYGLSDHPNMTSDSVAVGSSSSALSLLAFSGIANVSNPSRIRKLKRSCLCRFRIVERGPAGSVDGYQ